MNNTELNIPIMSNDKFEKITNYFKGTPHEEQINHVEIFFCEKNFPNVICLICKGYPRYFKMKADLIQEVAKTIYDMEGLSSSEEKFLKKIKKQLDKYFQIRMDIEPSSKEKILSIVQRQPGFKKCFEVTPVREGYQSYAVNINKGFKG